jgi:hypothetical protein
MTSVFAFLLAALLAAFLAVCEAGSLAQAQPASGGPPTVVSGPFDAYLSPGSAAAVLRYRKRDWPGPDDGIEQDADQLPNGAVVNAFSTAPFGTFRLPDDGGDIYAVLASGAAVDLKTKDGGVPADIYFCGDNWVLWGADVGPTWHSTVANIYQAPSASCRTVSPTAPAYTRYIEVSIAVPFMDLRKDTQSIDTIVHEHYDGPSVAGARNLERMYFGKNIGRYRWEYWVPNGTPRRPLVCPPLAYSAPPAPGWVMADCHMWTNLVPNATNFSLAPYGWGTPERRLPAVDVSIDELFADVIEVN